MESFASLYQCECLAVGRRASDVPPAAKSHDTGDHAWGVGRRAQVGLAAAADNCSPGALTSPRVAIQFSCPAPARQPQQHSDKGGTAWLAERRSLPRVVRATRHRGCGLAPDHFDPIRSSKADNRIFAIATHRSKHLQLAWPLPIATGTKARAKNSSRCRSLICHTTTRADAYMNTQTSAQMYMQMGIPVCRCHLGKDTIMLSNTCEHNETLTIMHTIAKYIQVHT